MNLIPENEGSVARMAAVRAIWIEDDLLAAAEQAIIDLHAVGKEVARPGFMALIGDSGTGKTSVAVRAERRLMPDSSVRRPRTVVRFTLPTKCTEKALVASFLAALGDPTSSRLTRDLMIRRLKQITAGLEVQLVVIDECQHLVKRENKRVAYEAADALKVLVDELAIPFVLIGTRQLIAVLDENPQLYRRMEARVDLLPFDYADPNDCRRYRSFLAKLDKALPFAEFSGLALEGCAQALHVASSGYLGLVVQLVKRGADRAIRRSGARIEPADLAAAWSELTGFGQSGKNPFLKVQPAAFRPKESG